MKQEINQHCWNKIGIRGDRSCPELANKVHCRNCSSYESIGRNLFDREPPDLWLEEAARIIAEPDKKEEIKKETCLVFRLGSEWLGLPAGIFVELTRPRAIRRVPHRSNQVFLGLVGIRGEIQLCFSVDGLLGIQPEKDIKTTPATGALERFCVISRNNRKWVFPVAEVCGLGAYTEHEIQPVPVTVAKTMQKYSSGVIAVNNRQTGLLNAELIIAAFERSLS